MIIFVTTDNQITISMKNYDLTFRFRYVEGTTDVDRPDDLQFSCTEEEHCFQSRQAREKAFDKRREAFIAEAWEQKYTVRHMGGRCLWYVDEMTGLLHYIRPYDFPLPDKEGGDEQTPEDTSGMLFVEDRETLLLRDGKMLITREREVGLDEPASMDSEQTGSIKNPDNPLRRVRRYPAYQDEVDSLGSLPLLDGYGMYPDEIIPDFEQWSLRPASVDDLYPAVKEKAEKGIDLCPLLVDGDFIEDLADEIHEDHRWQNYLDCEHPLEMRLRLELNYLFGREKGTIPPEMTREEFVARWENAYYDGDGEESDARRYVTSVSLNYYNMGDSPWGRIPSLLEVYLSPGAGRDARSKDKDASWDAMRLWSAYSSVCEYLAGGWMGVKGSTGDVFPDGWDDELDEDMEDDPFAEDLPAEGTPLRAVMESNGILTTEQRARYERYDAANPGCSLDHPIVITETENYVGLEYDVLELILRPVPYRFVDWRVVEQRLLHVGDRSIDELKVDVSTHPIAEWNDGDVILPEPEPLGTETYWFDVTAGFRALDEALSKPR